jgi:hypothetical protein
MENMKNKKQLGHGNIIKTSWKVMEFDLNFSGGNPGE